MDSLFSDFAPTSAEQWVQQIIKDLKGADYAGTLQYVSADGIAIKPFYTSEDLTKYAAAKPLFTFTDWDTTAEVVATDEKLGNTNALKALNSGASALLLYVNDTANLEVLLHEIGLEYIAIQFVVEGDGRAFTQNLKTYCQQQQYDFGKLRVAINTDPIEQLLRTGDWRANQSDDKNELIAVVTEKPTLCINSNIYHNAGAPPAYELACTLAHANVFINWLIDAGYDIQQNPVTFQLNIAVGPNYFFEIAKLRALRKIFALLFEEYNIKSELLIHAETAFRNLTVFDEHANLLRTTTAAMAASIGGCNSLTVKPFDCVYSTHSELAQRLAINIQLILKNESYFDKVADVSAGSYFIEELTEQIAAKAWEQFVKIEKQGGLFSALQSGSVQKQIEQYNRLQQQQFNEGKEILVGTNKFPNPAETKNPEGIVYGEEPKQGIIICTLGNQRLSAQNEKERLSKQPS